MTLPVREENEARQHSGWLVLLGLVVVVVGLCGLLLLYYLRPGPSRDNGPTAAGTIIALTVRGVPLRIPANYLRSRAARRGGDQDVVPLVALLPDMRGYSNADAPLFAGNAPDSPVLHLLIRGDTNGLDAASRLARVYMPYIVNPGGTAAPFGLTRYMLRADSGYGRDDLFVGKVAAHMLLYLCERPAQDLPSPNCQAIDRPVAANVNLSYRFKRAQLARWRQINDGADRLAAQFLRH